MVPLPSFVIRQLRKPYVEYAVCLLLKRRRLTLPRVDATQIWPAFETAEARVRTLPKGSWSVPTSDLVVLMKLASAAAPERLVELGSYRGYSAIALLEHAPAHATLTAIDIDPQHGEAYRDTPLEARIDRRVAAIDIDAFAADELGTYDLVFIDADHTRAAVERDTEVALRLVSPAGTVLWHDYANSGFYTGDCGVPEVLGELSARLPIAQLLGSNIAIHRPAWSRDRADFEAAVAATEAELKRGHWSSGTARPFA